MKTLTEPIRLTFRCPKCGHRWESATDGDCPKCEPVEVLPPLEKRCEHTPGPWKHNATKPFTDFTGKKHHGLASAVWANEETPICTTSFSVGKYNEVDPQTQHANARLIAAAPDLLLALQAMLEAAADVEANWERGDLAEAVSGLCFDAEQARAAIAKATE